MGLTAEALKRLRDAVGDDDATVCEILQSFVDEVDGLIEQLSGAVQADDPVTLRRVAHTLKSSCRDLGDHRAGGLCGDLEEGLIRGTALDTAASAAAIAAACRELKLDVERHIASLLPVPPGN